MPNDFTALERDANLQLVDVINQIDHEIFNHIDPIVLAEGANTYTEKKAYGSNIWTATSGSPTARTMGSLGSTTTPVQHDFLATHTPDEVRQNPGLVLQDATDAATGWVETIVMALWSAIAGADTHAHPVVYPAGVLTAQGGGSVYFADAFTVDPTSGGANFDQQNLYDLSLGASALDTVLAGRAGYRRLSGDRSRPPQGKGIAFGSNALTMTLTNLIGRPAELFDGSDLQNGGYGQKLQGPLAVPVGATSSTVWGIFWTRLAALANGQVIRRGPATPVVHSDMMIRVGMNANDNLVHVTGSGSFAIHFDTEESDLILSVVAS